MPIPDFITELRRHVGHAPLPLVGVTAVVVRAGEILLGHRSDNGALTPVTGIVDPGEEPAAAAAREALEEAGVLISVDRLAWVHQIARITYDNGDQSDYLDLTFRCSWVSGEPYPADGEMTDVGWYRQDRLDGLDEDMAERVALALPTRGETRFLRARSHGITTPGETEFTSS
jgi:8-oxo-dGTP pyrophosphatase MutT (NUDIX family)